MSLDALAAKFEQYRENLIKLTEASKMDKIPLK